MRPLAENEALKRRISDLEAFSSVRSSSSRGRHQLSSSERSAEARVMEPDYDQMFTMQSTPVFHHEEFMAPFNGDRPPEGEQLVTRVQRIMERTGSVERWRALRAFLGFPFTGTTQSDPDRTSGRPGVLAQGQDAGSACGLDPMPRVLFATQDESWNQRRSDRSQAMSGIQGEFMNPGLGLRPDPTPNFNQPVGQSSSSVARNEGGLEQTVPLREEYDTPQGRDPVFEWFNSVTAPAPVPQSRAGLAPVSDQRPGIGLFRDPPAPLDRPPPQQLGSGRVLDEARGEAFRQQGSHGTGSGQGRLQALQTGGIIDFPAPEMQGRNHQMERVLSSTGQGLLRHQHKASPGIRPRSSAPCLLDASPPKEGGVGPMVGTARSKMHGGPALSASPSHETRIPVGPKGSMEMLRDLNVEQLGLRGVRLATPGKDQEVVPVVHMPDRELGVAMPQGPPPSLDLLGLDPAMDAAISGSSTGCGYVAPGGTNPLLPGASTPFMSMSGPSYPMASPPPPPPNIYDSPRGGYSAPTYTPGGTRVPDGTPPLTPRVTFCPDVQYANLGTRGGVAPHESPLPPPMLPPAAPFQYNLPQASHRMEEPSKLVHHLPLLTAEPGTQDASVAAGDWIARIRPVLTTLSPSAGQWWESTHLTAFSYYQRWLVGEPSERLAVRTEVEVFRKDWEHLSLINERGAVLILGALTTDLQTECVTTRMLTAVGLLFTILVRYQPGGPSEKAAVLSFLSNPTGPETLSDSQASLRRWLRLYNRTAELQLHYPDPSLLIKGLDKLSHLIARSSHASFRLASYRHAQRLDYEPTQKSVLAYAQVLLGEVEQQLLAQDQGQADKRARVRRTDASEDNGDPKGKQPEPPLRSSLLAKAKAKAKPAGATPESSEPWPCKFFDSPNGCRYGKACRQAHAEIRKGAGRCYECGATTHLRPQCPRKDGPEEPPNRKQQRSRRGQGSNPQSAEGANQRSLEPRAADLPEGSIGGAVVGPQPKAPPEGLGPKLSKLALGEPLGLLDGGATHALRPVRDPEEFERSRPLKVGLASGETNELRINRKGTLVTLNKDTQPILPLGVAIRVLGMSVLWREDRCDVVHPVRGRIRVILDKGCPEVPRAVCLALIDELEDQSVLEHGSASEVQALRPQLDETVVGLLAQALSSQDPWTGLHTWLRAAYPEVPNPTLAKCLPNQDGCKSGSTSFNRHTRRKVERGRTLLHLFSGVQTWSHSAYEYTLNVDTERGWNLLDDKVYGYLFEAVLKGHVVAILAGPPCRTWSRLRKMEDDGPPPLRSRHGAERFGFHGLEERYQQLVEGDTVLLLRTLVLMEVMQVVQKKRGEAPGFVLLLNILLTQQRMQSVVAFNETGVHLNR